MRLQQNAEKGLFRQPFLGISCIRMAFLHKQCYLFACDGAEFRLTERAVGFVLHERAKLAT